MCRCVLTRVLVHAWACSHEHVCMQAQVRVVCREHYGGCAHTHVCTAYLCVRACVQSEEHVDPSDCSRKLGLPLSGTSRCHCPLDEALGGSYWTSGQSRAGMK